MAQGNYILAARGLVIEEVRRQEQRLMADLNQILCFLPDIATPNLTPDLVLWSTPLRTVYIIELSVPWNDAVEEAYKRKSLKYAELGADAEQWQVNNQDA